MKILPDKLPRLATTATSPDYHKVNLLSDESNQLQLVQQASQGDDQAMATLFGIYRDRLQRMVSFRMDRRLAARVSTSDVIQDVYIAAAKRLQSYDSQRGGSFLGWLRKIAEQTLIDLHRRHMMSLKRNARRETLFPTTQASPNTSCCLISQIAGTVSSPSHQVSRTETAELIEQAINRMDPVDREVLALRHFEELSNGDVADVLGLTPSAATNRYMRALTRLGSIMREFPDFDSQ